LARRAGQHMRAPLLPPPPSHRAARASISR